MKKFFLAIAIAAISCGSLQAQNGTTAKPAVKQAPASNAVKPAPVKVKPADMSATEVKAVEQEKHETEGRQLKKDGTPDKRYAKNRHLKKDGTPDKRHKEHKKSDNDDMKGAPKNDKK